MYVKFRFFYSSKRNQSSDIYLGKKFSYPDDFKKPDRSRKVRICNIVLSVTLERYGHCFQNCLLRFMFQPCYAEISFLAYPPACSHRGIGLVSETDNRGLSVLSERKIITAVCSHKGIGLVSETDNRGLSVLSERIIITI